MKNKILFKLSKQNLYFTLHFTPLQLKMSEITNYSYLNAIFIKTLNDTFIDIKLLKLLRISLVNFEIYNGTRSWLYTFLNP